MNQELQIKATISDIQTKTDKNNQPYYRISCQGLPARYFYVFSTDYQLNLNQDTLKLLAETPVQLVNKLVLITYQEIAHKNNNPGTFSKVAKIELIT